MFWLAEIMPLLEGMLKCKYLAMLWLVFGHYRSRQVGFSVQNRVLCQGFDASKPVQAIGDTTDLGVGYPWVVSQTVVILRCILTGWRVPNTLQRTEGHTDSLWL